MINGPFSGDLPDAMGLLSENSGNVWRRCFVAIGRSALFDFDDPLVFFAALELFELDPQAASSHEDPANAAAPAERRSIARRVIPSARRASGPSGRASSSTGRGPRS